MEIDTESKIVENSTETISTIDNNDPKLDSTMFIQQ